MGVSLSVVEVVGVVSVCFGRELGLAPIPLPELQARNLATVISPTYSARAFDAFTADTCRTHLLDYVVALSFYAL